MLEIEKFNKIFITGFDPAGQEIVTEIVLTENAMPQISIDVDASETYSTGRDPNDVRNWGRFINVSKRTISITAEFKEMYITRAEDAIDQDKILQLLSEEAS